MIMRVVIAVVGALVVTVSLLFAMQAVTSVFRSDSGERYFRITDILPKPDPGRPERPRAGPRQPESPELEYSAPDTTVPIEGPTAIETESPRLRQPEVERPEASDD